MDRRPSSPRTRFGSPLLSRRVSLSSAVPRHGLWRSSPASWRSRHRASRCSRDHVRSPPSCKRYELIDCQTMFCYQNTLPQKGSDASESFQMRSCVQREFSVRWGSRDDGASVHRSLFSAGTAVPPTFRSTALRVLAFLLIIRREWREIATAPSRTLWN